MSLPPGPDPACRGCTEGVAAGELFCRDCGRRFAPPGFPGPAAARPITVFDCVACGASMSFGARVGALTCPFCGTTDLPGTARHLTQPEPEAAVPFLLDPPAAVGALRAALGSLWLRPGGLAAEALVDAVHPCWISAWEVRARVATCWTADRPAPGGGGPERWTPAAGRLPDAETTVLVPASAALTQDELDGISPFTLVGPGTRPEPDRDGIPVEPFGISRRAARGLALRLLAARRRGDAQAAAGIGSRNLKARTRAESMQLRPVLVPVYVVAYVYRGALYRYLVNGSTGRAEGSAPYSAAKLLMVALAVALVALALARAA